MHRFSRRCSYSSDYIYSSALVVHRMLSKVYNDTKVWAMVRALIKHPSLYGGKPIRYWMAKMRSKLIQLAAGTILPGPFGQVQAQTQRQ